MKQTGLDLIFGPLGHRSCLESLLARTGIYTEIAPPLLASTSPGVQHSHLLYWAMITIAGLLLAIVWIFSRYHKQKIYAQSLELQKVSHSSKIATASAGIGIWERDILNDQLIWDEQMYEIYGVEKNHFSGAYEAWRQCVHPDDLERATNEVTRAEEKGEPFDTTFRIIRPNGDIRHIRAIAEVIRDEQGHSLKMVGINMDVTEKVEHMAPFQMLFQYSPSGVAIYSPIENNTNFIFVDMNPAGLDICNNTHEEIIGEKVTDCFPNVVESGLLAVFQRVADTGQSERVPLIHYEDKQVDIWVENEVFKLPSGLVISVFQDVTEQKRAEEYMEESRRLLQSTLDGLPAHIALLSEDGTILLVNKAWRDFAAENGGDPERCSEGANYFQTCEPAIGSDDKQAEAFAFGLRDVLAGRRQQFIMDYPCPGKKKDYWFTVYINRMGQDKGQVVVLHTDITDRKESEFALKRFNKAAIGRELQMMELKREVNALCRELGRNEPYPLKHDSMATLPGSIDKKETKS